MLEIIPGSVQLKDNSSPQQLETSDPQLNLHYHPSNTLSSQPSKKKIDTRHELVKPHDSKTSFLCTKEFLKILLLGQFLSLCITATILTSKRLFTLGANYPTTQTFLTYAALTLIFVPITIQKDGIGGFWRMIKFRTWKYLILAIIDFEGNYFVVKAYQFTTVFSVMLLDAWGIPCVVILSLIFLKVRYNMNQYYGVIVCLIGLAFLIVGDLFTDSSVNNYDEVLEPIKGDMFALIGTTCYGVSNVLEEYFVRKRPIYEVVGQLGLWGTIVSGIQIAILERNELANSNWTGEIIGLIIVYTVAMIALYTIAPVLFRLSSATFFNLSLLTSDIYSLILSIFLFQDRVNPVFYPLACVGTMLGLLIYHLQPPASSKIQSEFDNDNKVNSNRLDV